MHRPWVLILASLTACAGPAATHVSTQSDPDTPEDAFGGTSPALLASSAATHAVLLHQLLDSEAPLAPRLGADEVRAWVTRERFEPDAWMMDRGDLLGAR